MSVDKNKNVTYHFSKQRMLPALKPAAIAVTAPWEEFRMEKNQILSQEEKTTKIFWLEISFCVWLAIIFWYLTTFFVFFSRNSYVSWLLACLFGAVPQGYLRGYVLGLSSQGVRQIKQNSQLWGCCFFSVDIPESHLVGPWWMGQCGDLCVTCEGAPGSLPSPCKALVSASTLFKTPLLNKEAQLDLLGWWRNLHWIKNSK